MADKLCQSKAKKKTAGILKDFTVVKTVKKIMLCLYQISHSLNS